MIRVVQDRFLIGDLGINVHFAAMVKTFREERGYANQKAFADRLGIRKKPINRVEEKGGCASIGDFFIISMYLGVKALDFWRHISSVQHCELSQVAIPEHSKKVYGLNEKYYRDADYASLCKVIDDCAIEYIQAQIDSCDKSYDLIANQLGKYRSLVSKVRAGLRTLRLTEIEKLCEVLQVTSESLIVEILKSMEAHREVSPKSKF